MSFCNYSRRCSTHPAKSPCASWCTSRPAGRAGRRRQAKRRWNAYNGRLSVTQRCSLHSINACSGVIVKPHSSKGSSQKKDCTKGIKSQTHSNSHLASLQCRSDDHRNKSKTNQKVRATRGFGAAHVSEHSSGELQVLGKERRRRCYTRAGEPWSSG